MSTNPPSWRDVLTVYNLLQDVFPPLELVEINSEQINNRTTVIDQTTQNIFNEVGGIATLLRVFQGLQPAPGNFRTTSPIVPNFSGLEKDNWPGFERLKQYLDYIIDGRFSPSMADFGAAIAISGEGNMGWNNPWGCVVVCDPLPTRIKRLDGNPPKLMDAGILGWGQFSGWSGFERLEFERTAMIPAPPAVTGLRWILPPGVTAQVYPVVPTFGVQ